MLKDAARLPLLKLNPRSVYIIISVFVIAETFLRTIFKMFNCNVSLYVFLFKTQLKKMIVPKTQYVEIL